MTDEEQPDATSRRHPTVADLKEGLAAALKWNADLTPTPAFATIPTRNPTERGLRGFHGEDMAARAAVQRGEILLDCGVGLEDWNKGGPDVVTLAEREGSLVIKFYDNKAYTSSDVIYGASALTRTLDGNITRFRTEWGDLAKNAPTEGERRLYETVCDLIDDGKIAKVITNVNGRLERMGERLAEAGVEFEDMQRDLLGPTHSPFSSATSTPPPPPTAAPSTSAFTAQPQPQGPEPDTPSTPLGPRLGPKS